MHLMVTALVKIVDSFIQQMNGWEKFCNHLDESDLDENSICLQQTSRLEDIFNEFCTAKERKRGRGHCIAYGCDGSHDYDPEHEKCISVEIEEKKAIVYTERSVPLDDKHIYILKCYNKNCQIDSKKRYSVSEQRRKSVIL